MHRGYNYHMDLNDLLSKLWYLFLAFLEKMQLVLQLSLLIYLLELLL